VREVTGKPIKFASIGEKLEDFEAFHPDRMAGRILGMGDVMTLIEKAEATYSEQEAANAEQALMSGQFTLEDFLQQMQMLKRMGPLQGLLGMLPGMGKQLKDVDVDDKQVARVEAIIRSMTPRSARTRRSSTAAAQAHRRRVGHHGHRGQPAGQAVRRGPEGDEVGREDGRAAGHEAQGRPKGAKAQAAALRSCRVAGAARRRMGGFSGLQAPRRRSGKRR
jgi:signal recognition particle subunit SRP54